jgi:hypothetical protein
MAMNMACRFTRSFVIMGHSQHLVRTVPLADRRRPATSEGLPPWCAVLCSVRGGIRAVCFLPQKSVLSQSNPFQYDHPVCLLVINFSLDPYGH